MRPLRGPRLYRPLRGTEIKRVEVMLIVLSPSVRAAIPPGCVGRNCIEVGEHACMLMAQSPAAPSLCPRLRSDGVRSFVLGLASLDHCQATPFGSHLRFDLRPHLLIAHSPMARSLCPRLWLGRLRNEVERVRGNPTGSPELGECGGHFCNAAIYYDDWLVSIVQQEGR